MTEVENSTLETVKNEKDNDNADSKDDEFAYLDRDHFTSEKFKIEIRNLPKYYGMPELKKLLNKKLNLEANKVKRPQVGSNWIYVCFRSEEAREAGLKTLNGYKWKGKALSASIAKAAPDPLVMKRKNDSGDSVVKKLKVEDIGDVNEKLKDATSSLWRMPYEAQLARKAENARNTLKKLGRDLVAANPDLKEWMDEQYNKYDGLPCELLPIKASPVVIGYRNKCEFSIGINECTGEKTVGMRLGSYAKGSVSVVSPQELMFVPDIMKKACSLAEKFIRASLLATYSYETHEGYWKTLTARYGFRTNQLMLMFVMNSQKLTDPEIDGVEKEIRDFFTLGEGAELNVHSLMFATVTKGNNNPKIRCVNGEPFIYEEVCGYKFRLSPNSFFQINTEAAEVLFKSISELSNLTVESSLIDVCCGAGTIGICLSKNCAEVLGLEKWKEAVEDAEQNARNNDVANTKFFAGPAEEILSSVVHLATKENVVAIVDPPRAGLERNAVIQLRRTKKLQQFVYASCDPQRAMKNFVDFARAPSKQYTNEPFLPVRCVPVDMFPHTEGFELVIFFQRLSTLKGNQSDSAIKTD